MVSLFAGIPASTVNETLETIRKNLDRVEFYGGHTLHRHTDIQVLALKERLNREDIRYATSYWDYETARAVAISMMRRFYDNEISGWLQTGHEDCLALFAGFRRAIGYGYRKGEGTLQENLKRACLVLLKDPEADWGFRILTSYPVFRR